jgi:hypothetical protein
MMKMDRRARGLRDNPAERATAGATPALGANESGPSVETTPATPTVILAISHTDAPCETNPSAPWSSCIDSEAAVAGEVPHASPCETNPPAPWSICIDSEAAIAARAPFLDHDLHGHWRRDRRPRLGCAPSRVLHRREPAAIIIAMNRDQPI